MHRFILYGPLMHLITHNSQLLAFFFNNNKTKILKNGLRARIKGFTLISATISRFSFHNSFYFLLKVITDW